jgi:hypothetical protein
MSVRNVLMQFVLEFGAIKRNAQSEQRASIPRHPADFKIEGDFLLDNQNHP